MTRASIPKPAGLLLAVSAALGAATLRPAAAQSPSYTLTDLGTLGGPQSLGHGLNNNGKAVGNSDINASSAHGFLYSYSPTSPPATLPNFPITDLGTTTGNSDAKSIDQAGDIVGYAGNHAFVRPNTGSTLYDLGTLGGTFSTAFGINDITGNGSVPALIVGSSEVTGTDPLGYPDSTAFDHSGTGALTFFDGLGVLNPSNPNLGPYFHSSANGVSSNGTIVGTSYLSVGVPSRATLFPTTVQQTNSGPVRRNGTPQDLGALTANGDSDAYGADNALAVGDADTISGGKTVFLPVTFSLNLTSGTSVNALPLLSNYTNGTAFGISPGGTYIVGNDYNTDNSGNTTSLRGFLYTGGNTYDLTGSLNPLNSSGNIVEEADSVNDYGQIIASGLNTNSQTHAFLLSPTPTVTGLSPTTAAPNQPFTLTVTGTNFAPNAVVYYNGIPEPTTFNSNTQVTANIATAGNAGSVTVDVGTPTPGGHGMSFTAGRQTLPVYRLYKAVSNGYDFILTTSSSAVAADQNMGYQIQFVIGYAPVNVPGTIPLYEVYSPSRVDHFYTTSASERDAVLNYTGSDYANDGTVFQLFTTGGSGSLALHRLYNPSTGRHVEPANDTEYHNLVNSGQWNDEGTLGYISTSP